MRRRRSSAGSRRRRSALPPSARADRKLGGRRLLEILAGVRRPVALRVELEVALEMLARLRGAAELGEEEAEVVVGVREVRRLCADLTKLRDGSLDLAEVFERVGEVVP